MEELLTVTQAAQVLGLTRAQMKHVLRRGLVTPHLITGRREVYLRRAEVEALQDGTWRLRAPRRG